jgi:predicted metal-dependent hydrolase
MSKFPKYPHLGFLTYRFTNTKVYFRMSKIITYHKRANGMNVKIIRSKNRKKTISARVVASQIIVHVPAHLTPAQEKDAVTKLVSRIEKAQLRRELNSDSELKERAKLLNRRYFGGKLNIKSINYVTNQNSRHGSCTTTNGTIRIAHHIAKMPPWVRDYVIIHELAHLIQPNHSKAFWELVYQYEYAERARGYIQGYEAGIKK